MGTVDREIWIDGEFVPWANATVHVLSHSLQRGSLVFDYMSVHDTPRGACVFRLDLHVARFARSCELLGLKLPRAAQEIAEAVLEAVRRNPGATAVKVSAYIPSLEVDVVAQDDRVTIAIAAYDPIQDLLRPNPGTPPPKAPLVRLLIEPERRNRRDDIIPPQAKVSANYASPMTAKAKARAAGYDEIVLVDEHGHVAEGPTTNLFLVDSLGTLVTPAARDRAPWGHSREHPRAGGRGGGARGRAFGGPPTSCATPPRRFSPEPQRASGRSLPWTAPRSAMGTSGRCRGDCANASPARSQVRIPNSCTGCRR